MRQVICDNCGFVISNAILSTQNVVIHTSPTTITYDLCGSCLSALSQLIKNKKLGIDDL